MRRRQSRAVPPAAVAGVGDVRVRRRAVARKVVVHAEEPLLERGVEPRVELEVGTRAVRVAGLVVLGGVPHDPAAARDELDSRRLRVSLSRPVGSVRDFVEPLAHQGLAQPQFPERPLPVRHARQDGEQQVTLHRARHVAVRPLVPEVRQRRALAPQRLHERQVRRPVQPLGRLVRHVRALGGERLSAALHAHELHHHRPLVLLLPGAVRVRRVQPLGDRDEAPELERLGGGGDPARLAQPLQVLDGQRRALRVAGRDGVQQRQRRGSVLALHDGASQSRAVCVFVLVTEAADAVPPAALDAHEPPHQPARHLFVIRRRRDPHGRAAAAHAARRDVPPHLLQLRTQRRGNLRVAQRVRRQPLAFRDADARQRDRRRARRRALARPARAGGDDLVASPVPGELRRAPGGGALQTLVGAGQRPADPPVLAPRPRGRGAGRGGPAGRQARGVRLLARKVAHRLAPPRGHAHRHELVHRERRDVLGGLEPVRAERARDRARVLLAAAHALAHARGERVQRLRLRWRDRLVVEGQVARDDAHGSAARARGALAPHTRGRGEPGPGGGRARHARRHGPSRLPGVDV